MSFCRRDGATSDLYVYESNDGFYCQDCFLDPKCVTYLTKMATTMLSHLLAHRKQGDRVPDSVIEEFKEIIARDEETRKRLIQSKVWGNLVKELDVMALVKAGTINFSLWTDEEHSEIRAWACVPYVPFPKVIREYVELVKSKQEGGTR